MRYILYGITLTYLNFIRCNTFRATYLIAAKPMFGRAGSTQGPGGPGTNYKPSIHNINNDNNNSMFKVLL